MDNQQGNDYDLAWFAGFFDGEGSIMLKTQGGARLKDLGLVYYYPDLRICNTHYPTLKTCTDILDAHGLGYHVTHRNTGAMNPIWNKAWDIEVRGLKRCERWLNLMAPLLRTKQEQAYLMLEYINSRKLYSMGEGYKPRELEIIDLIRNRHNRPQRPHASTV